MRGYHRRGNRRRWEYSIAHLEEERRGGEHSENLPVKAVQQGKLAQVSHTLYG